MKTDIRKDIRLAFEILDKEEKKYEKDLKVFRIDASKGKKSLNTAMAEVGLANCYSIHL